MPETRRKKISTGIVAAERSAFIGYASYLPTIISPFAAGTAFTDDAAYQKGKIDGMKDMEIQLIKMQKALFQLAGQKATEITDHLIKAAHENNIVIYDFYLKIEDWDKIHSLIIVKLEDYISDSIFKFYELANQLSLNYNKDDFHWDYWVTYYSDNLSKEKILSDGYSLNYEHTPQSRAPQQGRL